MTSALPSQILRLGEYRERVDERLDEWRQERFSARLIDGDPTLWPGSADEIRDRLGWLDLPETGAENVPQIHELVREVGGREIRKVFLIGMGGSSLAPEVFESTFGRTGDPFVCVADSTHPDTVRRWIDEIDSRHFMFIVSSKSGSTLEMTSLFHAFWHAFERWHSHPGAHFIAITDSGSALEAIARERGFYRVFNAPGDVGGRFSALSEFGLVPAALAGADPARLLAAAGEMRTACASADGPGIELGAALGELALAGRDKLTFVASPSLATFPNWIEQLVAESLGKDGKGIVPVVGEPGADPDGYGDDRLLVAITLEGDGEEGSDLLQQLEDRGHPAIEIRLRDRYDLGAEILRWEVAVASAAAVLAVQPFDQPDVERSKVFTRGVMAGSNQGGVAAPAVLDGEDETTVHAALEEWLASIREHDYIAIQAFLSPDPECERSLELLQAGLRDRTGCAVTCGYGPRFLHSTGQLHKGGSDRGVFLQLLDRPGSDLLVAGHDYSFGTVIAAQADGDAAALAEIGRRLLRVRLAASPAGLLASPVGAVRG